MYTSMNFRTEVRVGGPDVPRRPATATALSPGERAEGGQPGEHAEGGQPGEHARPAATIGARGPARNRNWPYALGGALLVLMFSGMCVLGAMMATSCYELIREGTGMYELYLRSALFAGTGFIGLCVLPVIAERNCVGRFIARHIPV
ncbi:hypothetical protein [Streptomyces marianii]|uniref:Uncharacterized protein n=1 Tax=Streptomyces marianii TaxID=1817406 RepID=A0A5R9DYP4_9ACTN|nr:hypothetical protein [Streptomyces marianii]TLQ42307.1 hypothetical protein FEF34_02890 [Streptomyces marianii]